MPRKSSNKYVQKHNKDKFFKSALAKFKDCGPNRLKIMELFYELVFDCKDDYKKLIALRDAYDEALDALDEPSNRALLIRYATRFKYKISQPRDIDNWSKDRLLEHIVYHLAKHLGHNNSEALSLCMQSTESKEAWLNEHKS